MIYCYLNRISSAQHPYITYFFNSDVNRLVAEADARYSLFISRSYHEIGVCHFLIFLINLREDQPLIRNSFQYSALPNCSPPPPTPFFRKFTTQFPTIPTHPKLRFWETKFGDIPKSLPILQNSCIFLLIFHFFRYIFPPLPTIPTPPNYKN